MWRVPGPGRGAGGAAGAGLQLARLAACGNPRLQLLRPAINHPRDVTRQFHNKHGRRVNMAAPTTT
ncbi:hypothetical protein E2C01_053360 [Portunus trituberculatus]|uniref:Uncharacterized protein n=1 Tax=Portunus trituberculatus TaxID=210409 RepID=A0A5B7GGV8_PORTR|nr:hypothetical protein [Portunus trituberculatus]